MKKPTLFLHIGSGKAGSSALQKCLIENQSFLLENKICYSDFHEFGGSHADFVQNLIQEYCEKTNLQINSPLFSDSFINSSKYIINEMKLFFNKNDCEAIVLSSEFLFFAIGWDVPPDKIAERRNYVIKYFKEAFKEFDIKIVCYLRRQDDFIESVYNQFYKTVDNDQVYVYLNTHNLARSTSILDCEYEFPEDSLNSPLKNLVNAMQFVGEYYANLSEWADIYGRENIIVRPYERSQLPNGIERDFLENVLGLSDDLLKGLEFHNEVNAGMKKDIVEYRIATKLFDFPSEFIELNNSPALAHLNQNNKKNILTAKQAEHMLDYYKGDNEKIAREYLKREDGILFYDKRREEKDDYPGLSAEATWDISRELASIIKHRLENELNILRNELTASKNQIASLESDLDFYKGQYLRITGSLFWSLIRPLRWIYRTTKKIIKKLSVLVFSIPLLNTLGKLADRGIKKIMPRSLYSKTIERYKNAINRKRILDASTKLIDNDNSLWDFEAKIPQGQPLVSVIVPNYNHAPYLKERLDSIYSQSYNNIEVILLDDCSTDNSREILVEYAKRYSRCTKTYFNESNSGKVFAQWQKGISLAKGQYIWIAESDDYADVNFLEELVPYFEYQSVMLAFVRSEFVRDGVCIYDTQRYLNDIHEIDWNNSFIMSAHQIVQKAFAIKNIIPNVSSALFRNIRELPSDLLESTKDIKLCGDWLFYLSIIKGGAIGYTDRATNYYRIHANSTSLKIQQTSEYYKEHEIVSMYAASNYNVPSEIYSTVKYNLEEHYKTFHPDGDASIVSEYYRISEIIKCANKRMPNIIMCGAALQMGGGEIYPIHLANELKRQGYAVTFLDFCMDVYFDDMDRSDPAVRSLLSASLPLVKLKRISLDYLMQIICQFGCEIIHSHYAAVDEVISMGLRSNNTDCRHIVTSHGMYEAMPPDVCYRILPQVAETCSCFVYTAEKNLIPLKEDNLLDLMNVEKIGNALPYIEINTINRSELNIPEDAFVLCLVSRGIPEKGWAEAAEAVTLANKISARPIHLIIIGDGEMKHKLKKTKTKNIHLLGYKTNIRDYFVMSDMGFLPSRFRGESFPLVVVDCLLSGKPVLASNIAEIKNQLTDEAGNIAGEVFNLREWEIDIGALSQDICSLANNSEKYEILKNNVASVAKQYDIEQVAKKYLQVYMKARDMQMKQKIVKESVAE